MRDVQDALPLALYRAIQMAMKIRSLLSLIPLSLFALPNMAQARDYGEVAGWQLAASNNSCGLYSARAGNGDLIFLMNLAGDVHIQVTNNSWRSDDGSNIQFAIDGKRWPGRFAVAPAKSNKGAGYIAAFDSSIIPQLRAGRQLAVQRGGQTLGLFSLSGSAAALNRLNFCLNDLRRDGPAIVATAEEIAKSKITQPVPTSAPGKWFKLSDYPRDLMRAGKDGVVHFRLDVDAKGKVSKCTVTRSSGFAELDKATCDAAKKRIKFKPAQDGTGKKLASNFDSKVTWRAPK